jgi:trigger factor
MPEEDIETHEQPKQDDPEELRLDPQVEREDIGPCKMRLKICVAAEKVREVVEKRFDALRETVEVPGFRRGRAPRALLERKFGRTIRENLRDEMIGKALSEAVEKSQLEVIGEPELNTEGARVEEGHPFAFEATCDVMPKIEVRDYFGIEVTRRKVDVTEPEVDAAIERWRDEHAEWVPVDNEPIAEGHLVVADVSLLCAGEELDRAENAEIVVRDNVEVHKVPVPGFVERLTGRRAGDTVEVAFEIPKDHPSPLLAGKECTLRFTIHEVKRLERPEIDAELLRSLDMDTVEEFRAEFRKAIRRAKEASEDDRLKDEILEEIVRRNEFPLPDPLVRAAQDEAIRRFKAHLYLQGAPEEEIERLVHEHNQRLREMGERAVRTLLVVDRIADKERIFATEDMVEERIARIAQEYGRWPHEMREYLEERDLLRSLRHEIRTELVRDELLKRAQVREEG